jgi:DNA mismatch endonuclease (patch repair protein)
MDKLSAAARSANMSRIRSTGMKPELAVRSAAHRLGYRFRLHRKDLPGKPDLVFPARHKVIFVHGCFWHQHKGCIDGRAPQSNTGYWGPKLARNFERDRRSTELLERAGWKVLIVWECEAKDGPKLTGTLENFLSK